MFHAYALAYLGTKLPRPAEKRAAVADLSVLLREQPKPAPPPVEEAPPPPPPQVNRSAPKPRAELRKKVLPKKPVARKPPPKLQLPYPLEAVARGLEGDVMVRIMLDGNGDVVSSQLFRSSGHALLDDAAVAAARGLKGLPDAMAREAVLPVRFRLR